MSAVERIAVAVAAHQEGGLLLTGLHARPQRVIDDPQMRNLDDLPGVPRVRACHTLASARALHVGSAVPFEPADINRVIEQSGTAFNLVTDRRVALTSLVGPGHAFGIQRIGHCARALTVRIGREDPPYDRGFTLVDPPRALAAIGNLVNID